MKTNLRSLSGALILGLALLATAAAEGDPQRGADVWRSCASCHQLQPGAHMTGPSLAGLFGRKAGSLPDFGRYSPALKSSDVVWTEETLDAWIADPQGFIPGNYMTFRGIDDPQARADLIAFLRQSAAGQSSADAAPQQPTLPDLKQAFPDQQVSRITHCGDTYRVTTAAGEEVPFWEFNLRFKTDTSDRGPAPTHPVMVPNGMGGDRASVVFADPAEISSFIERGC